MFLPNPRIFVGAVVMLMKDGADTAIGRAGQGPLPPLLLKRARVHLR